MYEIKDAQIIVKKTETGDGTWYNMPLEIAHPVLRIGTRATSTINANNISSLSEIFA
jgi:hypothetical protein